MYGAPPLVTLDQRFNKIIINTDDVATAGTKFEVIINMHLEVSKEHQDPFSQFMPPFIIDINNDALYVPENEGVFITGIQ